MDDIVSRLRDVGKNLGQAIAGYRDRNVRYSAEGLAAASSAAMDAAYKIEQLEREIKYLRHYGNKDCTWQADEAMKIGAMEEV